MFYVYVLESLKNGRYYVGTTSNIDDRLKRHNKGQTKSTKPFAPYKMIYFESFLTLSEARRRESFIKDRKSRKYLEALIKMNK